MIRLPTHRMTPSFHTRSLRPGAIPMGHVLNVDHFHMSRPTFPPHPHAGFSAVTVLLPWSPGAFINRDSQGDRSRIGPGAIHWTLAGSGMMHEEIPEVPGVDCEGLQIFVKLPERIELTTPVAHHLDADAIPAFDRPGGRVRVLVGDVAGTTSPISDDAHTTLLHVHAAGTLSLPVPSGREAFAIALRGAGRIDGQALAAGDAVAIRSPTVTLDGPDLDVFLAWSDPMPAIPAFHGPFCMFRPERIAATISAHRAGRLGQLAPSPVTFTH